MSSTGRGFPLRSTILKPRHEGSSTVTHIVRKRGNLLNGLTYPGSSQTTLILQNWYLGRSTAAVQKIWNGNAWVAIVPRLADLGTGTPSSTTYLRGDGTWSTLTQVRELFSYIIDAGNSTTVETDLYSDSLVASTLGTNKDKLEIRYGGEFVSSGTATRQLKLYFGGTTIFDSGALSISLSADWDLEALIIRVSSSVVRYSVKLNTSGASASVYTSVGELTGLTLSNANIVKITGQAAGIGAASNDITAKLGNLEFKPAP